MLNQARFNQHKLATSMALALATTTLISHSIHAAPIPVPVINQTVVQDTLNAASGEGWRLNNLTEDVTPSGYFAKTNSVQMALSADDQAHKIYQQGTTSDAQMDLVYQGANGPEVIFNVTPEMITVGSMFYSHDIAIDHFGNPHVIFSYHQASGIDGGYAKDTRVSFYAHRDNNGWQVTAAPELADGHKFSLAMDSTGVAHIAYYTNRNTMFYAKHSATDTSWQVKQLAVAGHNPVVAINNADQPVVAYYDNWSRGIGYSTPVYTSSDYWYWKNTTIAGTGSMPSMALDSQGHPHISSTGSGKSVIYSYFDGTDWQVENVPDSYNRYAIQSNLKLGLNDEPMIAYQYEINYPSQSSVEYRLAAKSGGSWQNQLVWGPGNRGSIDLEVDSTSQPLLAFSAIPYFNSQQSAGWSTSVLTAGLPSWTAGTDYVNANPEGYHLRWDGVVIAAPEPILPVAEQDSYVIASGASGVDYFLRFDENGQYRSRMPSMIDIGDNMKPAIQSNLDYGSTGIVQGDFDNDGRTDFIAAGREKDSNGAIIEFHRKMGYIKNLFESNIRKPATIIDKPTFSYQSIEDFTAADFDNDGNLDFIMGESLSTRSHLYLGNGDGTFKTPVILTGNITAKGIDSEDLNNDGNADFIVSGNYYAWQVDVYLGDGTGNFTLNSVELEQVGSDIPTSVGITASDFDGDSLIDIVLTNYSGSSNNTNGLAFYQGLGDGTFAPTATYSAPEMGFGYDRFDKSRAIDNAYFNADQIMDVIVADSAKQTIRVYLGNGDGTFTHAPQLFAVHPNANSSGTSNLTLLDPELIEYFDHLNLSGGTEPKGISTPVYTTLVTPLLP